MKRGLRMKAREEEEVIIPIKKKFSKNENSKTYHESDIKEEVIKSKGKDKKIYQVKKVKKELLD